VEDNDRISREALLMETALLMAKRSTCQRVRVGAVLSNQGRIISSGYGGAPAGVEHCNESNCTPANPCRRTIHAEANAIAWAARLGSATFGSTLHVTLSPCLECAKLLINAGIERVVYNSVYRDDSGLVLLREVGIGVGVYADGIVQP
jgi:dCMP deaminase